MPALRKYIFATLLATNTCAGVARCQSEFISSRESAHYIIAGYASNSSFNARTVGGGFTMNGWSEANVYLAFSDNKQYGYRASSLGVGVRPFVRASEPDSMGVLVGFPMSLEVYSMSSGEGGLSSASGGYVSVGVGMHIPVRTGEFSRLDLSFGASIGDYLFGNIDKDGVVTATTLGVGQSIGVGKLNLLVLGVGRSFVKDADEGIWIFQLSFLFKEPR